MIQDKTFIVILFMQDKTSILKYSIDGVISDLKSMIVRKTKAVFLADDNITYDPDSALEVAGNGVRRQSSSSHTTG